MCNKLYTMKNKTTSKNEATDAIIIKVSYNHEKVCKSNNYKRKKNQAVAGSTGIWSSPLSVS